MFSPAIIPRPTSVSSDKTPAQGPPTKPTISPLSSRDSSTSVTVAATTATTAPILVDIEALRYELPGIRPTLTNDQTIQCITLTQELLSSDRLSMIVELARRVDPPLTHGQIRQIVDAAYAPDDKPARAQSRHKPRVKVRNNVEVAEGQRRPRTGPSKRTKKDKRRRRAKKTKK